MSSSKDQYDCVMEAVKYIKAKLANTPSIGIVCGSGLSNLADKVADALVLPYNEIPNFPVSSVQGHKSNLVFGHLGGKFVVLMQGRCHLYEGRAASEIAFPIRVMAFIGVQTLILTNASGSLRPDIRCGDFAILRDHINLPSLAGLNPLVGPNDERFGPRFVSMSGAYDLELRKIAMGVAEEIGIKDRVHYAVYFTNCGPAYETPAELRFFRTVGCDLIGMSTTNEVMAARHVGLKVFGLSLVSNDCILDDEDIKEPNHEEVLATAKERSEVLQNYVGELIKRF